MKVLIGLYNHLLLFCCYYFHVTCSLSASSNFQTNEGKAVSRRSLGAKIASTFLFTSSFSPIIRPTVAFAVSEEAKSEEANSSSLQNYKYSREWTGTGLRLLSYQQAAALSQEKGNNESNQEFVMGRWPDPILRRPASPIPLEVLKSNPETILSVGTALRRTARKNGAVGLAAQQCGIDASMIFLENPNKRSTDDGEGIFLVNPRIISRSSEMDMQVWIEECLVLPPSFRATVLRDATVQVQYEDLRGNTKEIQLTGELARAFQHELDHDRGVLIVDHVGLDELESEDMKRIETKDHERRQVLAYSRFVSEATTSTKKRVMVVSKDDPKPLMTKIREAIVPDSLAQDTIPIVVDAESKRNGASPTTTSRGGSVDTQGVGEVCDEACVQERKRIIQERRAMMNQSRTNTKRSDLFELSKQRAALYGTSYKGANCPPGVPCL